MRVRGWPRGYLEGRERLAASAPRVVPVDVWLQRGPDAKDGWSLPRLLGVLAAWAHGLVRQALSDAGAAGQWQGLSETTIEIQPALCPNDRTLLRRLPGRDSDIVRSLDGAYREKTTTATASAASKDAGYRALLEKGASVTVGKGRARRVGSSGTVRVKGSAPVGPTGA